MRKNISYFFLSKFKIKKQIFIVFLLAVFLSVFITGSFLTYQTVNVLNERVYTQLESDNLRVKSILFDAALNIYNISESLSADKELKKILESNNSEMLSERVSTYANDTLRWFLLNNMSVSSLNIYTKNQHIGENEIISSAFSEEVEQFFSLVKTPGSSCWVSHQFDEKTGSPELALIRSFPITKGDLSAIMVLRMSNNFLKNRIQNNKLFVSLSLEDGSIFYSTTRALQGTMETAPIHYENKYYSFEGKITYNGDEVFAYISSLIPYGTSNAIYINSLDFDSLAYIEKVLTLCVIIIILSISLPLIMISQYAKYFSSRVELLKNAMHDAKIGKYNIIENFNGDDELAVTFTDLRSLIENLKKQQADMFESEISKQNLINKQQQMQFKLLSSQINPHFIYNTLETIRMMALEHHATDVSSAVTLLGKTMRYVLENTTTMSTTIDKELDYIASYMAIQKLRFGDRINYNLEIPKDFDTSRYQILPILLQPIVENSIVHGLRNNEGDGYISIEISTDYREKLRVVISDNGKGMSETQLQLFNNKIEQNDSESIGLYNINQRIKLFYGNKFGFRISCENGTKIEINLPLLPAGDLFA